MEINSDAFQSGFKTLSPEILLKIFLNLDSHETVILRSVCKEFLEIIDNNKSLWRILDWKQLEEESPIPALEMFDEKSSSTLKEVSIFQSKGDLDYGRLIRVLDRSKENLNYLFLNLDPDETWIEAIELASNCPILNSLILWPSEDYGSSRLPRTHLTRTCRQDSPNASRSSDLQALWCSDSCSDSMEVLEGKLDLSSLVSFADLSWPNPLEAHSIISEFSSTLIHLYITFNFDPSDRERSLSLSSLSCPSLSVLEGEYLDEIFPWLDAPILRIVIAASVNDKLISRLPVSVEELWLLSCHDPLQAGSNLRILPHVCPKLRILKLGARIFEKGFNSDDLLRVLRARKEKVEQGAEIKGITMVLLEELILPTHLFGSNQLNHLREIVGEVIDIMRHPDFIELEY